MILPKFGVVIEMDVPSMIVTLLIEEDEYSVEIIAERTYRLGQIVRLAPEMIESTPITIESPMISSYRSVIRDGYIRGCSL